MNAGSELIIAWWLTSLGYSDDFTQLFIQALSQGCEAHEEDAILNRDSLIEQAMKSDQGDMATALKFAYDFHRLKLEVSHDTVVVDTFIKVDKLLDKEPTSKLASKMVATKLNGLLNEYRSRPKI